MAQASSFRPPSHRTGPTLEATGRAQQKRVGYAGGGSRSEGDLTRSSPLVCCLQLRLLRPNPKGDGYYVHIDFIWN